MAKKDLAYNYAKDQDFAQDVMANLLNVWRLVKGERENREEIWQTSYRAWSVDRNESDKQYDGRANLNLPQLRKEVETMSRRIYKALFPDDYLSADQTRLENEDIATVNSMVVRHYYDKVMNIRSFSMPWVKQGVIYGSSPARQFWDKQVNEQFFKERYFVSNKEGILEPKVRVAQRAVTLYDAPVLRAEDLFQTWIYPHNAAKPEDIKITFWRTVVDKFSLMKKSEEGMCERFNDIKDHGSSMLHDFEKTQERLQQFGESGLYPQIQNNGNYKLLEIWVELVLPGEKYPVPCVVEIINDGICTRIQRNPYWHQQAPFDWMRFIIPPPGEFYGRGLPEASISVQHQINDTLNQSMDSTTLSLNNITIINPAYAPNADSFEIEPRAIWWADPAGVKQMQFPDLSDTGIKNVGLLRSIITEMSDNSPQLPDPIAGKARSTGQAQLAVNEWQTDLYTIVELISAEAMASIAGKTHMLLQQNLSDDDVIRVSGKFAGKWINRVVTPEEILGRFTFSWKPSLQIENQAIRTQQMLNLPKVWGTIPPEDRPKINWMNYFVRLIRDGFRIKDIHEILEMESMNPSVPPNLEHRMLDLGGDIKVQSSDDDNLHGTEHTKYLAIQKDAYKRATMFRHLEEHKVQMQKKQMMMQMQQQMMMAQQQAQSPKPPGGPEGNPSQVPESVNSDDMQRGMRVE